MSDGPPPIAFGPFVVRTDLGRGRFGPLYLADDPETGRQVVVRAVTQPLDSSERQMLVDAFRWLCEMPLDHPAIARPLACGIEADTPFLVHAYLPGARLDGFLAENAPLTLAEVVLLITQLAAALDFAAAAGIHHGSLGARDIVVGPERIALTGVGLVQAMAMAGLGVEGRGTYESPQRIADEPLTGADDIFALGALASELVHGSAEAAQTPSFLVAIQTAMAADPQLRPPTALGFAALLQSATSAPETYAPSAGEAYQPPAPQLLPDAPFAEEPAHEALAGNARARDAHAFETPTERAFETPAERAFETRDERPFETPADEAFTDLPLRQLPAPLSGLTLRDPLFDAPLSDEDSGGRPAPDLRPATGQFVQPAFTFAGAHDALEDWPLAAEAPAAGIRSRPNRAPSPVVARTREPEALHLEIDERPRGRARAAGQWIAAALALVAIGLTAGFAVAFFTAQRDALPFPRSAAQVRSQSQDRAAAQPGVSAVSPGTATVPPGSAIAEQEPDSGQIAGVRSDERAVAPDSAGPDVAVAERAPSVSLAEGTRSAPALEPQASVSAPPAGRLPETRNASIDSPPPAADLAAGRILIRSTPAGAQVIVNGEPRGTTPLVLRELPLGGHTIAVMHPAYPTRQEHVTLTASNPARSIEVDLDRPALSAASLTIAPGALHVESRPSGAQVFVNDRLIGNTPLLISNVAAGAHRVRLELPGYQRWSTSISVGAGERARIAASLEQ